MDLIFVFGGLASLSLGGQKSEFAYHGEWVHNLWLDILNKVGLIPFVIAVIFTITSIPVSYTHLDVYKRQYQNGVLQKTGWTVIDGNTYYLYTETGYAATGITTLVPNGACLLYTSRCV